MPCKMPSRWIIAGMSHFGFIVVYGLRVNLSVALVAMVNSKHLNKDVDPECGLDKRKAFVSKAGEFDWDESMQGYILSSFFYGFISTVLPGGFLARWFGGKWVFGIGVLCAAILNLLTPLAARRSPYALIVVRILIGVGEGVTYPSMHALIAQWAPPKERSRFAIAAYSGIHVGTVITLPISGVLCGSKLGWPSVFYVFGSIGIFWFVLWSVLVYSRPMDHPFISNEEKVYIMNSLRTTSFHDQDDSIPWKDILLSMPQWSITVCHFCNNWVWYMILTGLPLYFEQVLGFDLQSDGFYSGLPFLVGFVTANISAMSADLAIRRGFGITSVRKFFNILGLIPCGVFLILASHAGCHGVVLSVVYVTLAVAMLCLAMSGFLVNHVDIAPRYSSVLMGISGTAGTFAGCLTPMVTGFFTENHPTRGQYRKVFVLAACISAFGGLFYMAFGSGEEQSWNKRQGARTEDRQGLFDNLDEKESNFLD